MYSMYIENVFPYIWDEKNFNNFSKKRRSIKIFDNKVPHIKLIEKKY